jgi:DNA adenine methylase
VSDKRLKAPFPAFGGKSAVAALVWERIGDVRNAIEPFCFSLAWLLNRPHEAQIETVNDLNPFVSNFWRAIQLDPEAVAHWADWPVNETDLHARHRWLVQSRKARASLARVKADPDYFDPKIAGWWCWGACMWIGSGWCDSRGVNWQQTPGADTTLTGVHRLPDQRPDLEEHPRGVARIPNQMPTVEMCSTGGKGVHGVGYAVDSSNHRPQLADQYSRGRGVHGNDSLTDCQRRRLWLVDWFARLADRLRPVRVCCGHWARVCDSDSTLTRLGTTGVFLDPPYRKTLADGTTNRAAHIYANDKAQDVNGLCDEVQAWCLKWGGNPQIRIALCGLEGEYPEIDAAGWDKVPWKSRGGYGNRTDRGKENAARERIWFSPACLKPAAPRHEQLDLYAGGAL